MNDLGKFALSQTEKSTLKDSESDFEISIHVNGAAVNRPAA